MRNLTAFVEKRPLPWVITIQLLLVAFTFANLWLHPLNYVIINNGDGMKNLFNLQAYVTDPVDEHGFFHFRFFNYPWGEYINTTDNTPGFAIALKWFCRNVWDVSKYSFGIFEAIIAGSIIATAVWTYKIFQRLLQDKWIALFAALVLPWTNSQTIRIPRGHFNLGIAFFMVWAIWSFIRWADLSATNNAKRNWSALSLILCIVTGFLFHGYYIAIIGMFVAGLLFFYSLHEFRNKKNWKAPMLAACTIPAAALAICVLYMKLTDGFLSQRPDAPKGYDWIEQKVRFWSLFTSPKFYRFHYWIQNNEGANDPENKGYLGHIAVYGLTFIAIALLANKKYRSFFADIQKRYFSNPILTAIFLGGLMMLMVNFGEYYYPETYGEKGVTIHNLLNPLLWLHLVTKQVEQFRSLGRFQWPFFWTFNIWVLYTAKKLLSHEQAKKIYWLWVPITFLGLLELGDFVGYMRANTDDPNILHPQRVADLKTPNMDYSRYQAAIVLPFYHVGAEVRSLIVDDYDDVSRFSFQFYLKTHLPLLNVKLARTVPEQAQQYSDWFHSLEPGAELRKLLNQKPILVIRNKLLAADSARRFNQAESKQFMLDALYLPERTAMQAIDSCGDYVYYAWYPLLAHN